jgi:hypothetical protein
MKQENHPRTAFTTTTVRVHLAAISLQTKDALGLADIVCVTIAQN